YPQIESIFRQIEGEIDQDRMIDLNSLVELSGQSFSQAASTHRGSAPSAAVSNWKMIWKLTKAHTLLVVLPVLVALALGVPLGILATKSASLGRVILMTTGLFQTIPSLAL